MNNVCSGDWLTRDLVRRIGWICLSISVAMLVMLLAGSRGDLDSWNRPLGTDFSGVWTAGKMALAGQAAQAWDWPSHLSMQQQLHGPHDAFFGWHYPPPFLLLATLLATMPYLLAWGIWQAVSLGACVALVRKIVPDRETILLALAAPVTLVCVTHGHNGFLTATLLGGGLLLMDRRPFLAGLMLGCLIYKPQFALLIGPLLIVTRNWRAFTGASVAGSVLVSTTVVFWGWPVWYAFIDSLPLTRAIVIEAGTTGFHKIMSPFAAIRLWGGSVGIAYAVQMIATALAIAGSLFCALRGRRFVRNAAACAATVIATPYVLDYDFVVVGVGVAFLVADARVHGWASYEKTLLALIWFTPMVARTTAMLTGVPLGLLSSLLLLGLALRRGGAAQLEFKPWIREKKQLLRGI